MSVSAHKLHGPKGVGFLYVSDRARLRPIIFGGGQQKGMRSGTENVPGIAGMGKAIEFIYKNFDEDIEKMRGLKSYAAEKIECIEGVRLNGYNGGDSAPHIISVSIEDVRAEVMLHALEDKGVYVSSGSACASNKPAISATLKAIGVDKKLLDSTIRLSMSTFTTKEEIDYTIECMEEIIPKLKKYVRK
jgi:cysteine desulfurase